jgi:hypothetical protein
MRARSAGQEAQAAPQTRAWQSRISQKSITTMLVYKEMCDKKGGTNGCERTRLRTVLLLHGMSVGLTSCLNSQKWTSESA